MLTGSSVSDDALSTRNRICALVAVSGLGFSSCSARMALRPMGVAALSRPKALAAKFSVIKPRAGWPRGTSGIRRANRGASQRASTSTMPAFSAMRKKPSHSVSVPNSSTITSTESLAMANSDSTMVANTWAWPPKSHCASAEMAAVMKKPSQRVLSMWKPGAGGDRKCQRWCRVPYSRWQFKAPNSALCHARGNVGWTMGNIPTLLTSVKNHFAFITFAQFVINYSCYF